MPGRKFTQANSGYRYGFNGQEKSDEIAAGLTTALYWEYDSRIARRWNLDPVPKIGESEYACFGNNPIYLSDPSGNQPDPPGKKSSKSYDLAGGLRSANIHFLAARVALFTYEARAERKQYNWKLNKAYQQAAKKFSVVRYLEDNVSTLGIDQAAFTKIVNDYYVKFEKAFNYAADETMKELKFIYYNKFDKARDIFKPNLTTNEAYDGIHQTIKLLDDMCDEANTIASKWQVVLDKCFMFAAAWACSGIGSGAGVSTLTGLGLKPNIAPRRTDPRMPANAPANTGGQKALDVVEYAANNNGASRATHRGGVTFANDGRGGGQILPQSGADGSRITYKEYDVNPYQRGVNRGTERVVIGSDGKAYYTNDHYRTFNMIK